MRAQRRVALAAAALLPLSLLVACGGSAESDEDALLIYSGRNEKLVGPLLDKLEKAVGMDVEVRYAGSPELAAQLLEEGERTPADVFFSQDAGALGALAKNDMLGKLPAEILDRVSADRRDAEGRWVATSGRARVIAYNDQAPEVTKMTSIDDILQEKYRGKIGFAPTNASWMTFVTGLRVIRGEAGAEKWLTEFKELEPVTFENNIAALEGVDSGEVSMALINHYYWYPEVEEKGLENVDSRLHFLNSDDPGALINVAGAGVLAQSDHAEAARKAVAYLVSDEAQQYFADETAELPVVAGVTSTRHDLSAIGDLKSARVDLNDLDSLDKTQALLEKVGLL